MKTAQLAVVKNRRIASDGRLIGNKILLALPDSEFETVRSVLDFAELPQRLTLHEAGEKQRSAFFLNHGLASIVVSMSSGRFVEAGVTGCEGVVGTALAVGLDHSPLRVIMQIEGDGFRVAASDFQSVLEKCPELTRLMHRYAVLQGMQVAQTAACNRVHDIRERLARWLLMAQDRVDNGSLPLTHDFLAIMLGSDRPSVTLSAAALRRRHAIRSRRGAIEVVSRRKLEACACECYPVVRELGRQLGLQSA